MKPARFDTKELDLGKNAGAALVNDLVGSKDYDFSVGLTIATACRPTPGVFNTRLTQTSASSPTGSVGALRL